MNAKGYRTPLLSSPLHTYSTPYSTPPMVAAACGVSIKACIRRTGCLGTDPLGIEATNSATATSPTAATMHALREIGGGR